MDSSMEFFSTRLGDLVSDERKKTGKSQNTIAREIGISSGALSQYISEKREPGAIALIKIAKYFNVSPNDLLFADGEKWNDDNDEDLLCAKIHSYTGLSKDAIKILREEKNQPFFTPVINTLILENSDGGLYLIDNIKEYMISDLWDDIAKDERYNTLPGSGDWHAIDKGTSTAEYRRKNALLEISEDLPEIRNRFYSMVLCADKKTTRKNVKELAMHNIKASIVQTIVYDKTQLERLENEGHELDEKTMEEFEAEIRTELIKHMPEFADYQGTIPVVADNLDDYDEFCAAENSYVPSLEEMAYRREKALTFLREFIEYRRKNTTQ